MSNFVVRHARIVIILLMLFGFFFVLGLLLQSGQSSLGFSSFFMMYQGVSFATSIFASMLVGLLGRSWMIGLLCAALFTMWTGIALLLGMHAPMGVGSPVVTLMTMEKYWYLHWAAFLMPSLAMNGIPFLLMRAFCGWRLTRDQNPFSRREPLGIEDILLFTATVACFVVLLQVSVQFLGPQINETTLLAILLSTSGTIVVLNFLFTLPSLWMCYRIPIWNAWIGSFFLLSCLVVVAFLIGSLVMQQSIFRDDSVFISFVIFWVSIMVGIAMLRWLGFQLVCYSKECSEASEDEKTDQRRSRKLHRILVLCLMAFTVVITSIGVLIKQNRGADSQGARRISAVSPARLENRAGRTNAAMIPVTHFNFFERPARNSRTLSANS